LANFLSLEREGERILKLVENGRYYLNRSTKRISIFFANLIAAKAYINIGNETIAERILLESLKLLEGKNFYLYGVYQERKWLPAFLERFVSKIPQCSKLLAAYQDIASGPSETRKVISRNWEYIGESKDNEKLLNLRVYSLGSFRIFIENEEIPLYKCKSKKALTLLRYLFFTHNKGCVSKDIIEELLWPDSRPKQADLNFRVTLSMLRRFLSTGEGGPKNFPNIVRKGDGFQLCLGREGWSDVDKFIDEMNLAGYKEKKEDQHEAARHYMNAEDLYKGDFLIENLYDDWCSFEREQFKNQYLHVLTKILNYYEQQHNYNEAIQYCYKILKVDPYSENIFRKLMQYYFELGYRKEVDSVFKLCQRNIEGDLEVSLSYETKELHRKLYSSLNA
jgi:DNA-binding SARP family transcriptional activator